MKISFDKIFAFIILILTLPFWPILFLIVKLDSKGSFIFVQRRLGLNKKKFNIYKIRTMIDNAEKLRGKYSHLNNADGPIFTIKNDPRFTKAGKYLSQSGIDELPQLINVLKGEMAFVGPRPLPVYEAEKIPDKYNLRFSVLPGMTSLWVVKRTWKTTFKSRMQMDIDYVKNKSRLLDLRIVFLTVLYLLKF